MKPCCHLPGDCILVVHGRLLKYANTVKPRGEGMENGFKWLLLATVGCSGLVACGWMEETPEPDRTITVVSIIGIIIIWGSFFYHKFVQGGGGDATAEEVDTESVPSETADAAVSEEVGAGADEERVQETGDKSPKSRRKKGKKRR